MIREPNQTVIKKPDQTMIREPDKTVIRKPDQRVIRKLDQTMIRKPDHTTFQLLFTSRRAFRKKKLKIVFQTFSGENQITLNVESNICLPDGL